MSEYPERDDDWLTDLFGRHSRSVLSYARRRLDSAEDAEDVVVEVFATAWRRRDVVPESALPWLYATAANVMAHVIRAEGRRSRLGARLAAVRPLHGDEADPSGQALEAVAARDVVATALDELSESDAELLRLWAWEQLEPTEIAVVLGCSPGTARTRLHRARTRLRAALVRRGVVWGAESSGSASVGTPRGQESAPSVDDPASATGQPLSMPTGSEDLR